MKQIFTGKQMKTVDDYTIKNIGIPGIVLMERAKTLCGFSYYGK